MSSCVSKNTVTFNEDGWGNGMTCKKPSSHKYESIGNRYKVYIGRGYLYFDESDFNEHFTIK